MKVMFRNSLRVQADQGGHKFQLINEFIVYVTDYGTFAIPEGFWTDFASIPQVFQSFIPVLDKHLRAAVLHDYMYYAQELNARKITRSQADKIFDIAMRACGVNFVKRNLIYTAVRVGGWVAWNKYKNDRIKNKELK